MTPEVRNLRLAQASAAFWKSTNLGDLAKDRHIPVVTDLQALTMPDWPADESADAILDFVAQQRRADRDV